MGTITGMTAGATVLANLIEGPSLYPVAGVGAPGETAIVMGMAAATGEPTRLEKVSNTAPGIIETDGIANTAETGTGIMNGGGLLTRGADKQSSRPLAIGLLRLLYGMFSSPS